MKLIKNTGSDRVIDKLRQALASESAIALASPAFSLFAFAELREALEKLDGCRVVLPDASGADLGRTGAENDRAFRNRLQVRWLARECAAWVKKKVDLRSAPALLPQSILIVGKAESELQCVSTGNCAFTTEGLGLTPGNQFSLIQCSERPEESAVLGGWFTGLWNTLPVSDHHKAAFLARLRQLVDPKAPSLIYFLTLFHVFKNLGDELDEERIVKSATGIRNTTVWKKLYKFQRDGVVGAIDKLERLGGCIIADSVGLGKTFEALAIIKYYELRNDRVLVLVPKRLRDNWTLYKANDRRNFLAADRFNYDVLNHTDLSRDGGNSGDIDLAHVNWGNDDTAIPPGVIFCLRAAGDGAIKAIEPGYPLAPHYIVHVGNDGTVLLPFTQAKQALDRLKRLTIGRHPQAGTRPDAGATARFDKATKEGRDMRAAQDLLAKAVSSILGKNEERAIASLFTPGGTHAMKGEFQGINDFEVVAFLVVLPEANGEAVP